MSNDGFTRLTIILVAASDIHVGSGQTASLFDENNSRRDENGNRLPADIAEFALGADDNPVVPGSSIKGALRQRLALHDQTLADSVFGVVKKEKALAHPDDKPGTLIFSGARLVETSPLPNRVDRLALSASTDQSVERPAKRGTIVAKRTSINNAAGVPENNLLYQAEMVPTGARFKMTVTLVGGWTGTGGSSIIERFVKTGDETRPDINAVRRLFATLLKGGIPVGRGKADGQGVLRLANDGWLKSAKHIACADGKVIKRDASEAELLELAKALISDEVLDDRAIRTYALKLTANHGAFFVGGHHLAPSEVLKEAKADDKGQNSTIWALRTDKEEPVLPGSSLMGALRAKFQWWSKLQLMQGGKELAGVEQLLFGASTNDDTPRSASLRVREIRFVDGGSADDFQSVKIDRFSQGPFDQGLFTINAFPKPTFEVVVALDHRLDGNEMAVAACDAFMAWLASDNLSASLTLGGGGNRGFGWFDLDMMEMAGE